MQARTLIATLALALALGGPALADEDEAALDPAKEAQVRAILTEQGYEVRSVGMEDGRIEVYTVKDGALLEIYLDESLAIAEVKSEDETRNGSRSTLPAAPRFGWSVLP